MANTHLTDPTFWEDVEANDIKAEITRLESLAERSKGEDKKLTKLRHNLERVRVEAERLAEINRKWQSGDGPVSKRHRNNPNFDPNTVVLEGIVFDQEPKSFVASESPHCSYCSNPVDYLRSTEGRGKPFIRKELVHAGDEIIEKVTAVVPKVIACENCCREVRKPVSISIV